MFDIITKEDYWNWLAASHQDAFNQNHPAWQRQLLRARKRLSSILRPVHLYELKDVQDAFILSRLENVKGKRILEVGGGDPRVLRRLSEHNDAWLVDRYEGTGRGPRAAPRLPGITLVQGYMGEFIQQVPSNTFDYVFSVSVVEHVPLDRLERFFADCARVLKPAGRMFHAIDTYLFDPECEELSQPFRERLHAYLQFVERPDLGIRLEEAAARIEEQLRFSCAYATQPDNVMHEWHLYRPQEKRLRGQVVSIKSAWQKVPRADQEPG